LSLLMVFILCAQGLFSGCCRIVGLLVFLRNITEDMASVQIAGFTPGNLWQSPIFKGGFAPLQPGSWSYTKGNNYHGIANNVKENRALLSESNSKSTRYLNDYSPFGILFQSI